MSGVSKGRMVGSSAVVLCWFFICACDGRQASIIRTHNKRFFISHKIPFFLQNSAIYDAICEDSVICANTCYFTSKKSLFLQIVSKQTCGTELCTNRAKPPSTSQQRHKTHHPLINHNALSNSKVGQRIKSRLRPTHRTMSDQLKQDQP
jgi:hypothetical protein